jgi:sugar phosphate isomerase/epimerase
MAQLGEMLDPVKQVHVMGKRNFGMHLKDHDNKRKTDVIYGQDGGVLDVVAVLKALKEEKFAGYVAIEYEAKPEEPTADVKELVKVVQESAKKVG